VTTVQYNKLSIKQQFQKCFQVNGDSKSVQLIAKHASTRNLAIDHRHIHR